MYNAYVLYTIVHFSRNYFQQPMPSDNCTDVRIAYADSAESEHAADDIRRFIVALITSRAPNDATGEFQGGAIDDRDGGIPTISIFYVSLYCVPSATSGGTK